MFARPNQVFVAVVLVATPVVFVAAEAGAGALVIFTILVIALLASATLMSAPTRPQPPLVDALAAEPAAERMPWRRVRAHLGRGRTGSRSPTVHPAALVGITGLAASGKGELAHGLSNLDEFERWGRASFGRYIEHWAREHGLPTDNYALHEVGNHLLQRRGADRFCRDVLEFSGWDAAAEAPGLIIEDVLHPEIWEALGAGFSRGVLLEATRSQERRTEALLRKGTPADRLDDIARHPTERAVERLLRATPPDLRVATDDIASGVDAVRRELSRLLPV